MTLYVLPTRATRKYRGKYPNCINSISTSGTDRDGAKAAHWETNAGERFTCSYDRMDIPACNAARNFVGINWMVFVLNNTPVTAMTQEQYDAWLAEIRTTRGQ